MIVTSPTGRWKIEVSRCHRSTNEDKSPRSPVFIEHAIRGLSPVPTTSPSMTGTSLPKLCSSMYVYVGEAPAHWKMVLQGIRQMRSSADEHQPVSREKAADTVPPKVYHYILLLLILCAGKK